MHDMTIMDYEIVASAFLFAFIIVTGLLAIYS